MSFKHDIFVFAAVAAMAVPVPAWAFGGGGVPGCTNLPDYARAAGSLVGLRSCDMSVEVARRIVAAHDGQTYQQAAPVSHRRHRSRSLQQQ